MQRRHQLAGDDVAAASGVAIVRVEQLYPWPAARLSAVFDHYQEAEEVLWLQEEPENMGAWSFVHARLHALLPERLKLRHVSRNESASPAIGSAALHQLEQADLLRRAIG
jgi:2-oxoglutarate dehydrogenase complex dehydrogenase (E1) component-like enzyme